MDTFEKYWCFQFFSSSGRKFKFKCSEHLLKFYQQDSIQMVDKKDWVDRTIPYQESCKWLLEKLKTITFVSITFFLK